MGRYGTGQPLPRTEDLRFLTGRGRYTADIDLPGELHLAFWRSPYAHGCIRTLDVAAARDLPGVIAVYTGQSLLDNGVHDVTGSTIPGSRHEPLLQPPLARDRVRYVGEPVVAVVARTLAVARDAVDLVDFDVDDEQAVVTIDDALAEGAPQVHAHLAGNRYGSRGYGDQNATDAAFADAAHVVAIDVINNRLSPAAMEPRGCVVDFDADNGATTVYQGCQGAHTLRDRILRSIDMDAASLTVISPDVGGGFGPKFFLQCETVVAVHASRTLGKPVKWIAERAESFLSDVHGRDHMSHAELALDADYRFTALRVTVNANLGAYASQAGAIIPWFGACMSTGAYDIPVADINVNMVVTNTVPVDAYRGAGRPEAAYLIERLVDRAAAELSIDRIDLRRRNFIGSERFPYRTPTGRSYDSGDYTAVLEAAILRADWQGFAARREASAALGRLRGIGLGYYVEICSAGGEERTHVRFEKNGRVTVLVGTQSTGQGHETSFAQLAAASLGIDMSLIDVVMGDTARVPTGQGTNGSRSLAIAGSAMINTIDQLIEQGRRMAAVLLAADPAHIEFAGGGYRSAGADRELPIAEVAAAAHDDAERPDGVAPGLAASERFAPEDGTFPNGCHVCEVEIDPDTGMIEVVRYVVEDDVGVVINPLLLEGQIVGGVAQGLGQALTEEAVYERDSGQLLSATFMDYGMPRADRMPGVEFRYREIPSPRNPLGVKGAGEAGTVGAAPALVNAVLDALAARGIAHLDMPLTPLKIWRALHAAA